MRCSAISTENCQNSGTRFWWELLPPCFQLSAPQVPSQSLEQSVLHSLRAQLELTVRSRFPQSFRVCSSRDEHSISIRPFAASYRMKSGNSTRKEGTRMDTDEFASDPPSFAL